jgi:hypothetical protein
MRIVCSREPCVRTRGRREEEDLGEETPVWRSAPTLCMLEVWRWPERVMGSSGGEEMPEAVIVSVKARPHPFQTESSMTAEARNKGMEPLQGKGKHHREDDAAAKMGNRFLLTTGSQSVPGLSALHPTKRILRCSCPEAFATLWRQLRPLHALSHAKVLLVGGWAARFSDRGAPLLSTAAARSPPR